MFCFQSQYFQLKTVLQFYGKGFCFSDNLFQSLSIENVRNRQWLSHKNIPVSQTEGYFENPWYRFLEEPMFFLWTLKWKFYDKAFFCVNTKNNKFYHKSCWKEQPFIYCLFDESPYLNICTLNTLMHNVPKWSL